MAYTIGDKVYTDYPLMDEIVYNTKLILNGIVVKNEYVAHLYETEESIYNAEVYVRCKAGTMSFDDMPFTHEMLRIYGYSSHNTAEYILNRNKIPVEDRKDLLEFCTKYYVDTFVEINKYYRSLMGLPEYNSKDFNIYITPDMFPEDYDISYIDFSKPIHEQSIDTISILKSQGIVNKLIDEHRSFNYSYLRFIGDLALDCYTIRKAAKWDILYIPTADNNVISRFQELYNKNKEIYLRKSYQDAYAYGSDYYDHMMIFIVLSQTFNDMIVDTPEWYIRRDIFDIRSVKFFLDSYGIPFFEEIPLKYQIKIVKNLNKLIKYKSTEQNFDDILDIFNLRETNIYKYFLYKKRKVDEHGHYIEDEDLTKMYDLLFIEVLLGDTYDNYIKDLSARTAYDEITLGDEYWDGTDDHDKVKLDILSKDFTIEPTKYMSIRADIDYISYQKQLKYFMNLILDSRVNLDDIRLSVPSIAEEISFKLADLFILMVLLSDTFFSISDEVIRPEDVHEEKTEYKEDFVPTGKEDEWWLKQDHPEYFTTYDNRTFGFNPEVELEDIKKKVESTFKVVTSRDVMYSIKDFGVENYIDIPESITTFDDLIKLYENNIKCYDNLNRIITHSSSSGEMSVVANYIFTQLFTKTYDYGFANEKDYLSEVLKDRDYTLYTFYEYIKDNPDESSRNKDIESILNEIISSLEYYCDRNSLDYLLSFVSTSSFTATLHYIYLMLNAFKSYKTHFIEPTVKYILNNPDVRSRNHLEMYDKFVRKSYNFTKRDKEFIHDFVAISISNKYNDYWGRMNFIEILDIYTKFDPDPEDDYDYDGGSADTNESSYIKIAEGGTAELSIPYNNLNGHTALLIDLYSWDKSNRNTDTGKMQPIDDSNGKLDNQWSLDRLSEIIHDHGIDNNEFVNNNFFIRLYDNQDKPDIKIAARTGLVFEDQRSTYKFTETWREWLSINQYLFANDIHLLSTIYDINTINPWNYHNDDTIVLKEILYKKSLLSDIPEKDKVDLRTVPENIKPNPTIYGLDNIYNNGIDISIKGIDDPNMLINTAENWIFEDLDEPPIPTSGDHDFGDDDTSDPGNVTHDCEYTEESTIVLIESLGNKDTSRVITITI